jgi:hypothetical protein
MSPSLRTTALHFCCWTYTRKDLNLREMPPQFVHTNQYRYFYHSLYYGLVIYTSIWHILTVLTSFE